MIARDIYEVLFCDDVNFWEATKSLYKKLDVKQVHRFFRNLKRAELRIEHLTDRLKQSKGKERRSIKHHLYYSKRSYNKLVLLINNYFERV